jgi:hypothetical protein
VNVLRLKLNSKFSLITVKYLLLKKKLTSEIESMLLMHIKTGRMEFEKLFLFIELNLERKSHPQLNLHNYISSSH